MTDANPEILNEVWPNDPRVLAKRGDPETSHEAACEIAGSEVLGSLQQRACEWVERHPGKTARELAELANDRDIRTINRRLSEVEQLGRVVRGEARPCSHTGRRAHTWYPAPPGTVPAPHPKKAPRNVVCRSEHQRRVNEMMICYRRSLPKTPTMPDEKTRLLRARLLLAECFETMKALGFAVRDTDFEAELEFESLKLVPTFIPNLIEIADGCADISVVTIGTLSACGIADDALLKEVDANNLLKLKDGSWDEHGKLVKPEGHQPPNIERVLRNQGWAP